MAYAALKRHSFMGLWVGRAGSNYCRAALFLQGLQSVHENVCRPSGDSGVFPISPGTSVPGFHIPPLRGCLVLHAHREALG
jgi:hypothetical protein